MRVELVAVSVILVLCPLAQASEPERAPSWLVAGRSAIEVAAADPERFGTVSDAVVTVTSGDFHLFAGTENPFNTTLGTRSCNSGVCGWGAGVQLPSGAQIRGVEVSACDGDPVVGVGFAMLQAPKSPAQPSMIVPFMSTAAAPGCATFEYTLPSPVTVQNDVGAYVVVFNTLPGTNVEWNQYRVRYRLQVSPAPATATFPNDVPTTHPLFRFVEALAASGVTGGCAPGSYCPDSPLTRGQMAVFLATALGLHFPN